MGVRPWLELGRTRGHGDCVPTPQFEPLEPRLLLSSEPVGFSLVAPAFDDLGETALVVDLTSDERTAFCEAVESSEIKGAPGTGLSLPVQTSAEDEATEADQVAAVLRIDLPAEPNDAEIQTGLPVGGQTTAEAAGTMASEVSEASVALIPSDDRVECALPATPVGGASSMAAQLVETLRAANGPPQGQFSPFEFYSPLSGGSDLVLRLEWSALKPRLATVIDAVDFTEALALPGQVSCPDPDAAALPMLRAGDPATVLAPVLKQRGLVILQPEDPHASIGIGDGASGDLLLDQATLDVLFAHFSAVQVGGPEGAHEVEIGGGTPVVIGGSLIISTPQPGGKIRINSPIVGLGDASFTILGSGHTTDLDADINIPGDYIPGDAVVVHGVRTVQAGGRIEFNTTSVVGDGDAVPDSLTLVAGTTVAITVPVGGGGLNALSVEAGTGITTSAAGSINLTGAAGAPGASGGELTLRVTGAGDIVLQGEIVSNGGPGAAAGDAGGNGGIVSVIAANGSVTVGRIVVQGGPGNEAGAPGQDGTVQISAGTTIAQQAGSGMRTNNLKLISGGNVTLTNAGNNAAILAAEVNSGGTLQYTNDFDLTVGVVEVTGAANVAAKTGVVLSGGNGAATIRTWDGGLIVDAPIEAAGSGAITLETQGTARDLLILNVIRSGTGSINLTATGFVTQSPTGDVLTAGALTVHSGGEVPAGFEADLSGAFDWLEQGPETSLGGQIMGMDIQGNPVSGAIQSILVHPTDPNIVYVGTVGGGLWRTLNINATHKADPYSPDKTAAPDVSGMPAPVRSTTAGTHLTVLQMYRYKITFVDEVGDESNASTFIQVTLTGTENQVQLRNIPAGPAGTRERRSGTLSLTPSGPWPVPRARGSGGSTERSAWIRRIRASPLIGCWGRWRGTPWLTSPMTGRTPPWGTSAKWTCLSPFGRT
jgi:hypothetical protein